MSIKNKKIKVLLVDDQVNIREMFSYILEERGFIAEVAKDEKEAVQKVAQDKPISLCLMWQCQRWMVSKHVSN